MDFFAAQDNARQRTARLVWLFIGALVAMVAGIYFALMAVVKEAGAYGWWDPVVFALVSLSVLGVVGVSSLVKIAGLRTGGAAVAESVGGRRLDPRTADAAEQQLLNIVEEMAIAAGVPVPAVYILPQEESINAFAAGFAPDDAAVAFTRGSLEKLNRDELQGVVAHEFAHILNGDMRLNIHLIGVLFGILVLSIFGRILLRSAFLSGGGRRSRDSREAAAFAAVVGGAGLVLLLAGSIGVFFGRLIQSAVSRQREYLADASAVQFTRYPSGLAGALRKIGEAGSRVQHPHSQDVAHLFFANGLRSSWAGMFATHPPLESRIRAIDASWDGSAATPARREAPAVPAEKTEKTGGPSIRGGGARLLAGVVAAEALGRAQAVREDIQQRAGDALRDPLEARALVYALLIDDSLAPAQAGQLAYLRESAGVDLEAAVERRGQALAGLPPDERLALVEMVLPVLSLLEGSERSGFLDRVRRLVLADGQVTWFAFAAGWMVRRHLAPPAQVRPVEDADKVARASAVLLGFLALMEGGEESARAAFQKAVADSPVLAGRAVFPEEGWPDYQQLEGALEVLSAATFALRKEVLEAAGRLVTNDGAISPAHQEVLRWTAATLDCPAPLVVCPENRAG